MCVLVDPYIYVLVSGRMDGSMNRWMNGWKEEIQAHRQPLVKRVGYTITNNIHFRGKLNYTLFNKGTGRNEGMK